ncbi:hypothetical protein P7K49_032699 [Saguinus oedipus]|uniref:Uncharacterized protein n=1 Tax=Saguinus oedipus TaxID=9490 RepID=A0ABQ9TPT0_SAGOE|nr:hypothetical protein P7K49_032699 [Saguinus oedipus]
MEGAEGRTRDAGTLEKEIEVLERGDSTPASAKENAAAPSPAKEGRKTEVVMNSQQAPVATPKEKRISNTPVRTVNGSPMMKAGGLTPRLWAPDPAAVGAKSRSWGTSWGGGDTDLLSTASGRAVVLGVAAGPRSRLRAWGGGPSALVPWSHAGPCFPEKTGPTHGGSNRRALSAFHPNLKARCWGPRGVALTPEHA